MTDDRQELRDRIDDFARGPSPKLQKHAIQMQRLIRTEVVHTFQMKAWVQALEAAEKAGVR